MNRPSWLLTGLALAGVVALSPKPLETLAVMALMLLAALAFVWVVNRWAKR